MDVLHCLDSEATLWGVFNPGIAPDLLFYAYIPTILISLLLGYVVFANRRGFTLPNTLFTLFTLTYSLYLVNEVVQWVAIPAGLVEFAWTLIALYFVSLALLLLYFTYTFLSGRDATFKTKLFFAASILPIVIFLPTSLNTSSFDLAYCQSNIGPLYYYIYTLLSIIGLTLGAVCIKHYRNNNDPKSLLLLAGGYAMLFILMFADLVSEYLGTFEINLVGPIGMLLLMSSITFMIVRYHAFNIKLAGAQALVIGLLSLVGALLFVVQSPTSQAVAAATFFFTAIAGYFLVRSVKKEIKQREELQVLTEKLAKANDRLKELDKLKSEFVSIASHQMRSPLTSMRGYASMVLDGSYGAVPDKAREAIQRIADSSAFMAKMIENYLNVSRIESGNMKYELSDFNLKLETEKVVDDKRQEAMKKGLLLTFKSNLQGQGIVHADIGKTLEIVHNLLNNALKYTPKGTIDVTVHDDPKKKKIYVDIHDSGIGMKPEDIAKLFGKFERAENANTVNITGTGLGLYVARTMALAMKGEITASSSGQGQGSTFRFELPMMM